MTARLYKLAVCFPTTVNPKPRSDCSTERTNGRGSDNVADGGEKPATVFVSVVVKQYGYRYPYYHLLLHLIVLVIVLLLVLLLMRHDHYLF